MNGLNSKICEYTLLKLSEHIINVVKFNILGNQTKNTEKKEKAKQTKWQKRLKRANKDKKDKKT